MKVFAKLVGGTVVVQALCLGLVEGGQVGISGLVRVLCGVALFCLVMVAITSVTDPKRA